MNLVNKRRWVIAVGTFVLVFSAGAGPAHPTFVLGDRVRELDPIVRLAARARGVGGALELAWQTRGEMDWYSVAWDAPDSAVWRRGERLVLKLKNGSEALALKQCGVDPEGNALELGRRSLLILHDDLDRRQFRHAGIRSHLVAGFRLGIDPDSVTAVYTKEVSP